MPRVRLHLATVTRRQLWDFGAVELSRGLEMIARVIAGEDIGAGGPMARGSRPPSGGCGSGSWTRRRQGR